MFPEMIGIFLLSLFFVPAALSNAVDLQGYSLIASNGVCKHVNGGYPTNCYKSSVSSLSSCEAQCTSGTPCVGFYYKASAPSSLPNCRLITSDSSCPSGFSLSSTTVATSKKDL